MSFASPDLVGDGTSSAPVAAAAVENNAECALDMLLVATLLLEVPTGASADRLHDGGWEKANTTPDGQHDELATAAAAMATAITDVLFDDMNR